MKNLQKNLLNLARRAHSTFDDIKSNWPSSDPIMIQPYRGYASPERVFLKGRVLEDENLLVGKNQEEIKRLINSFKRFESDEIPGVRVKIEIGEHTFERTTDSEGYFTLDVSTQDHHTHPDSRWIYGTARLPDILNDQGAPITSPVELFQPDPNADFGVISDIDDTLLQTHVTSLFQLKMYFITMFKEATERLAMEGMVDLYKAMEYSPSGAQNPFFYVSNSPWNIYDLLEEFMDLQEVPRGPILLRDIGFPIEELPTDYRGHKIETISHILRTYPDLPFIMFGDTGAHDADVYLTMAKEFDGQIKTIYIRHLKDTKNARRIAALIESQTHVEVKLIEKTLQIVEHAKTQEYVSSDFVLEESDD